MAQISTASGLIGEEYSSFDDLFAVTAFDWSARFRFDRVDFEERDEAASYAMDLEYLRGVACYVGKAT